MKSIPVRDIQFTHIEPNYKGAINIRKIDKLLDGKDLIEKIHRHDFFFILALEKGVGFHAIDFIDYPVHNQSLYFIRPGQVHELNLKAGGSGFILAFNLDFYPNLNNLNQKNILRQVAQTNYYALDSNEFDNLKSIFINIQKELKAKPKGFEEVIRSYLSILITAIYRINGEEKSSADITYFSERLEKLVELIEKDIYKEKKVSYYANKMKLSPYQLNTITKKTLGKTCSELISNQVLLETKRLLLATTMQVNEIAFYLGYDDSAYFIRFFKKHIGTSPNIFRSNFK